MWLKEGGGNKEARRSLEGTREERSEKEEGPQEERKMLEGSKAAPNSWTSKWLLQGLGKKLTVLEL